MRILAHLDLDAFFAAVEELENPELREKPLVVGGDPHGRGVVSTANYAARKFGIHSAMSCGGGASPLPARRVPPPQARALPPVLARRVGHDRRDRPADRAHGDRRGLPRPRHGRLRLHAGSGHRLGDPDSRARTDEPDVLARGRHLEGRVQDRLRPAEARRNHRRPSRHAKRGSWRRSPSASCPASGRARRNGCGPPVSRRSERWPHSPDAELRAVLPGTLGPLLRNRAQGIDPRDLDLELEQVSVSAEDTFARDLTDRERLHEEVRRLAELVSERLRSSGLSGRTVTAKLRYGDFSIRTRSTTLAAAVDEAGRDRGRRLRPPRSRPARPAGSAAARRRRRLGALAVSAADARRVVGSVACSRPRSGGS